MGGLNLNLESVEATAMLRLLRMVGLLVTTEAAIVVVVLELEEDECSGDSVVHSSVEVETQLPTELREGL